MTDEVDAQVLSRLRASLAADVPSLDVRWLYDDAGSAIYERITELPEYYPARVEQALLDEHAVEIAERSQAQHVVELGSGASDKTRALIAGFVTAGGLTSFTAVDVNVDAAQRATRGLTRLWPEIAFHAAAGDFTADVIERHHRGRLMVALLGGTIGNVSPEERARLLARVATALAPGDCLLLGADLVKSVPRLLAAYDDAHGLTAEFMLNGLRHVNTQAGGNFDLDSWEYVVAWDAANQRVDMRVSARAPQRVRLAALDLDLDFEAGDEIAIEVSAKFTVAGMQGELQAAGLVVEQAFVGRDAPVGQGEPGYEEDDFALLLARRP